MCDISDKINERFEEAVAANPLFHNDQPWMRAAVMLAASHPRLEECLLQRAEIVEALQLELENAMDAIGCFHPEFGTTSLLADELEEKIARILREIPRGRRWVWRQALGEAQAALFAAVTRRYYDA